MNFAQYVLISIFTISAFADVALPKRFDLRQRGEVTESRKQMWGTCWAFASIASLESNLLVNEFNEIKPIPILLSEYHMDKFSGFTRNGDDSHVNDTWYSGQGREYRGSNKDDKLHGLIVHLGGDFNTATSYLTHNMGAVSRWRTPALYGSKNPHKEFGDRESQGVMKYNSYRYYMPSRVLWLTDKSDSITRNNIKKAIIEHGAVASSQFMEDIPMGYVDPNHEFHFYYGEEEINHAVNLVGWDDNVTIVPLLPGAWLVRDSDHKDDFDMHINYFYISYHDKLVTKDPQMGAVSFQEVQEVFYDEVQSHALHGWIANFSSTNKIRNKYPIKRDASLKAISFISPLDNDKVELTILNTRGETICNSVKKELSYRGFYKVPLSNCKLKSSEKNYYVELKLASGAYSVDGTKWYKVLLGGDLPKQGEPILVKSIANKGESFYFSNNKWHDLYNYKWQGDMTILNQSSNFVLDAYLEYEE